MQAPVYIDVSRINFSLALNLSHPWLLLRRIKMKLMSFFFLVNWNFIHYGKIYLLGTYSMTGTLAINFNKFYVILTGTWSVRYYCACLQMRRWRPWKIKLLAQSFAADEAQTSSNPRSDFWDQLIFCDNMGVSLCSIPCLLSSQSNNTSVSVSCPMPIQIPSTSMIISSISLT